MGAEAEPLLADGLVLEPLRPDHAAAMTAVLADPGLYRWTGGSAPTTAELTARYRRQTGGDPTGRERWLNWVIVSGGRPVGYVQATVAGGVATLAWVVAEQGHGHATRAATAVAGHLGLPTRALIHPDNVASVRVAEKLGMRPTADVVDGETVWTG